VHLNGTPRERLADGYRAARQALRKAEEAMQEVAPNARDYYPQGLGAFEAAAAEHAGRLVAIRKVREELFDIEEYLANLSGGRS
jgi:hypothetical protein